MTHALLKNTGRLNHFEMLGSIQKLYVLTKNIFIKIRKLHLLNEWFRLTHVCLQLSLRWKIYVALKEKRRKKCGYALLFV